MDGEVLFQVIKIQVITQHFNIMQCNEQYLALYLYFKYLRDFSGCVWHVINKLYDYALVLKRNHCQ